jgi:hypothetical protein
MDPPPQSTIASTAGAVADAGWVSSILPDYFSYWNHHGQNSIFNDMNYRNPVIDKLIDTARFEPDPQKYDEEVRRFVTLNTQAGFSTLPVACHQRPKRQFEGLTRLHQV